MELIKSKGMVLFVVLVLGVTYISSMNNIKLERKETEINKEYVAINL